MKNSIKKLFVKMTYCAAIAGIAFTTSLSAHNHAAEKDVMKEQEVVLYGVKISPYVLKTRIVLAEKKVSFKLVETLPTSLAKMLDAEVPAEFKKASPLGKIPAMTVGDWSIADSAAIAGYIEKAYPKASVQPKDPKEYALSIWFERYADDILSAATRGLLVERVVKPQVLKAETDQNVVKKILSHDAPAAFDYLEASLKGKKWITGDSFSIADAAIIAQLVAYETAGEKIDDKKWPNLASYLSNAKLRPSVKESL